MVGVSPDSGLALASWRRREAEGMGRPRITQEEWDQDGLASGLVWLEPITSAAKPHRALCLRCGLESKPWPSHVRSKGGRCKWCTGRDVPQRWWDLRVTESQLEWTETVTNANGRFGIRCLVCGHEYKTRPGQFAPANRPRKGGRRIRCPRCAKKTVSQEEWRERAGAVEIELLEHVVNTRTAVEARCLRCGSIYKANPRSIEQGYGHRGCYLVSEEEWQTRAAAVGARWIKTPESAGGKGLAECQKCGARWPAFGSAISRGSGCPDCANWGINLGEPGLLYLVRRGWILKIGITNATKSEESQRLGQHRKAGFEILQTWAFSRTEDARRIEQATIRWWREDLGFPALEIDGKPSKETVDARQVSLESIIRFINERTRPG